MSWSERRLTLGAWPSPIRSLRALRRDLWMKDDGLCHPAYAGNKVRKLEHLLYGAKERVITLGAVGSHHVLATAVHGNDAGHKVEAVVIPRPFDPHMLDMLRATLPRATLHRAPNLIEGRKLLAELGEGATVLPAGGSNPVGALGYVSAAMELAEQVREGVLPAPRRVFVALGTGGTAAGLAVGLKAAGLSSEVVAVRVVPTSWLDLDALKALVSAVSELTGYAEAPITVQDAQLGAGYGLPTASAKEAVALAKAAADLRLEGTYTGKALAAAMHAGEGPDLFWCTLSRQAIEPLFGEGPPPDPAAWGFVTA